MKKIAFIIDKIESPTAGTEKQLLLLIKNLDRKRFTPLLCVLENSQWINEQFIDCPVYVPGIKSFKNISAYLKLIKLGFYFRSEKVEIVQTYFRDAYIAGVLAAKIGRVKYIISTRRNQGYRLNKVDLKIFKCLNRMINLLVANSEDTKRWVLKNEGISEEKVITIHNSIEKIIEGDSILKKREIYRQGLGLPEYSPVIGIVANLRPIKGLDIFIKAAAIVKKEIPEAKFVIIGDGEEKYKLMQLSHFLGLNGNILFLNRREDIPSLLTVLDVGVLSSHSESFSNAILEYLATGLPIVCTDVGGCREAVEEGINGFIVRSGDYQEMAEAIIKIVKKEALKNAATLNREKAEKLFSLKQMVRAYESQYEYV